MKFMEELNVNEDITWHRIEMKVLQNKINSSDYSLLRGFCFNPCKITAGEKLCSNGLKMASLSFYSDPSIYLFGKNKIETN